MRAGLIYYPADRLREGLVMTGTLGDNLSLPGVTVGKLSRLGIVQRRARARATSGIIDRLAIRPADPKRPILGLSGGNQQKALLGRAFARDFAVHVFDEPTVGIDVGAKVEVYRHIAELCAAGAAVLVISSDMEEIVGIAHRVYVIREGRVVQHIEGADITEEAILAGFFADTYVDETRTDDRMGHECD
jgi:ribose transport system ATP-binding protein